ncbi:MAG: hypothetical protein ISR45_04980 [Rhodospirillales bacterium]|nr:hypothetical protein [Rhodospirillales bacterium]
MSDLTNLPSLDQIKAIPVGDIASLPAAHLALLQDQANESVRSAKLVKDWLEGAIAQRYLDRAHSQRQETGKDTGTVHFDDGLVTVTADLPKKVDWDQAKLSALVERMKAEGDNPAEYVDIIIKISERKYTAWPNHIRSVFEKARNLRTGKASFHLSLKNEV